jgi:predicted metal-dependent hydrolase
METLELILKRKPIKNINLRIDREGKVCISAPLDCPLIYIQQFVDRKQQWIQAHQSRLQQQVPTQTLNPNFLGDSYPWIVHEYTQKQEVLLQNGQFHCFLKTKASKDLEQTILMGWLRQQMLSRLPALIEKWEPIIGVKANHWTIRSMKSRWGSCNPRSKRICLNLTLIQKPLICLEYVLVHELVHLLEASHNHRFQSLMSQFMPQWRHIRKQLNEH